MIQDGRRPPFCYQTHDALDALRERFEGAKRSTAIAVYVVLTEYANREGGEAARDDFRASRADLAAAAGISPDTLDRYVVDLTDAGLVAVVKERVGGVNLPNRWSLLTCAPPSRTRAATLAAPVRPFLTEVEQEPSTDVEGVVREAWASHAPPLIAHRAAYFATSPARSAIKRALKVYPLEAVTQAVANYATVLGSDGYRWSHSWTMVDFLNRGLDKFVPEADPLGNFRDRTMRAGHSFDQLDELG